MTPKEKALSLVEFFTNLNHVKLSDYSRIEWPTAKQCALKVVDEMIKELEELLEGDERPSAGVYYLWEYYKKVKIEIDLL